MFSADHNQCHIFFRLLYNSSLVELSLDIRLPFLGHLLKFSTVRMPSLWEAAKFFLCGQSIREDLALVKVSGKSCSDVV